MSATSTVYSRAPAFRAWYGCRFSVLFRRLSVRAASHSSPHCGRRDRAGDGGRAVLATSFVRQVSCRLPPAHNRIKGRGPRAPADKKSRSQAAPTNTLQAIHYPSIVAGYLAAPIAVYRAGIVPWKGWMSNGASQSAAAGGPLHRAAVIFLRGHLSRLWGRLAPPPLALLQGEGASLSCEESSAAFREEASSRPPLSCSRTSPS